MEEEVFMIPSYNHLSIIQKHSRKDYQLIHPTPDKPYVKDSQVLSQLLLLERDVGFLKTFSFCLETWNHITTDDEEIMETLRSMIVPLKVIWPEEHQAYLSLIKRLTETRPFDIQVYQSAYFELESKVQQSKLLIKGWCENLMHFKFPVSYSYSRIWYLLRYLQKNLDDLSWRKAAKIVQLKKPIGILKAKIVFLENSLSICKSCPYGLDNSAGQQFLNFVGDFTSSAICLTCLFSTKEANEETATEMNIFLFDMLQKFLPSAPVITTLYIGILRSYDFQPSDSFHLEKAVESFVDFFFDHLNHDFVILRDRLLFLFTFLTDPPRENVDEEGVINSQIYALFREDAYLLLRFVEMKEDFHHKKTLLNDFMIKIDVEITKIRQLYSGFSDSWIRSEVEKMEDIYFVSIQKEFSSIERQAKLKFFWYMSAWHQLQLYRKELRFLRMFLLCFGSWDDTDDEIKVRLSSTITSLQRIWGQEEKEEKGLLPPRFHAIGTSEIIDWDPMQLESQGDIISTGGITNWDSIDLEIEYEVSKREMADWHQLALELDGKIKQSKLEIEAWWVDLFHSSFRCKPSTSYKIQKFLDSILENLNDLVKYKSKQIVPFRKQIETLKDKLVFLKNFLRLAANCICGKELAEFKMFVQVFANDAACLTFLYWAKDGDDNIASETNSMLSHTLQKIKPTTPDVAQLYFETLKAIYVQQSDSIMFGQTALSFVDLFLEDLVTPLKDDFQILRDDIVFLLTFLNDPPNENAAESICSRIDVSFWEGVYGLLPFDDMEGDFSRKKTLLSDFMMTIETVNANIRHIYGKFPDSSIYNFPKVISPRFLDFLIQNLKNLKEKMISDRKYAPFAKYKIIKIEEELVSLCPFFDHIFDLQRELNETWLEVVNSLYLIEHVINLCINSCFVFDHPIWYHMAYLSEVLNGTKVVKTKLENIKENTMYNARCLPRSIGFMSTPSEHATHSEINEVVVGFENEVKIIIGMLTQGHMSLDIVSIVGMGGLGKTTLAKKVYGSSLVKCNFVVFAFCSVSQDHNTRKILLGILCDINGVDDKIKDMTDEDLAHQLWKCLSRRKYLIVLDDIWYTSAWNKVKSSFPDDKNGSRVMFTTRSREVADICKINCGPYQLRFLSEDESLELLQKKVFRNGISPPYLFEIGRLIAKNCKGLPLAVVVIAGLLARTEKSLRWWSEVAERAVSYLSEGCKQILELSYKHLPKDLKPCFVYLGAFPEDSLIRVKQVILLWIAEGFIEESRTKSIEDVAKEYFHDLVDRSLIMVSTRSSTGEIKTFRVHDLIHDLCQTKCREGNFFQLNHGIASSSSSDPVLNKHYRVSTQKQSDVKISADSSLSSARSLLYFRGQRDDLKDDFPLRESRLAQVLDLDYLLLCKYDIQQLTSAVNLRHIHAKLMITKSIPSSISNLWNIGSLMLASVPGLSSIIELPKTFWRMKSLRHVKIDRCILTFSDETYHKLDKVVSFSKPNLSRVEDVKRLLERLPVVRELSCILQIPLYDEETLDFGNKLESLKLTQTMESIPCLIINFPSTLKKLTLEKFQLPWTDISAIAELKCLEVLKLQGISFPGPRFEMEDLAFQNLKFFELDNMDLVEWNASTDSLPCLEQLVIGLTRLEELPPCFGEISTLKRIVVKYYSKLLSSAHRIRDEQMELGNDVEVSFYNGGNI